MMRRHEKDFMLRGEEKYGDQLEKRIEEFSEELAKSELPAATKNSITKLMQTYRQSFLAYMVGQTTLTEEADDLTQIYERLRPTLVAVRKAADERLVSERSELASVQAYVFYSICITIGAVGLFAFLFGRWLSTPLIRMAGAMEALTQGELDCRLEQVDRKDEIGKISRALSVFQEKLLENRQLTEDRVKAEEAAALERKNAMLQVADAFEQTISKIVDTVSRASSEIEAAAGTLTKTGGHHARPVCNRGGGVGTIVGERKIGGFGDRGNGRLGLRNQPPGRRFADGCRVRRRASRAHQCAHCRIKPIRKPHRRRGQDDFRRSRANQPVGSQRDRSKPPVPEKPVGVLPS